MTRWSWICRGSAVCAAILVIAVPRPAVAALGEAETTVASDAQRMHGSIKSATRDNYRIHTLELGSGTVVREFVSLEGNVFAVAWTGPSIPNLRQMLGRYFDNFTAATQAPHAGHRHLQVSQDDFVMQSNGHMRDFTGRAYIPSAIPAGVTVSELH